MEVLKQLKELYNSGILVLNKKVLEKVRFYLRPEKVLLPGALTRCRIRRKWMNCGKSSTCRSRRTNSSTSRSWVTPRTSKSTSTAPPSR